MGKKKKKKKSLIERFNEREAKGDVKNTLIKGGVDSVASSVIGTGVGAISGKYAALSGISMILLGHYYGDESGILRVTGASALAYGIAKAKDYQENAEHDSAQKRLKGLGNDLLTAFHVQWKTKQNEKSVIKEEEPSDKDISELVELSGGIQLAEELVKEHGIEAREHIEDFQDEVQNDQEIKEDDEIDPFDDPETDLSLI